MNHIYCDGSVYPNPGKAGWAFVVYDDQDQEIHHDSGAIEHGTNNIAEMTALLRSLQWARDKPVVIHSDSQYTVRGTNEWMQGWRRKNWIRAGEPIPNASLWQQISDARQPMHRVVWVRGHVGLRGNERADELAGLARLSIS